MPEDHSSRTSVTLLGRLRQDPKDQAAWNDFVARYQPKILQWCRGWRLQESDAQDVTQAVLLKLSGLMAKFAYDPSRSFRGWLKTLTHHAWRDLVAERKRGGHRQRRQPDARVLREPRGRRRPGPAPRGGIPPRADGPGDGAGAAAGGRANLGRVPADRARGMFGAPRPPPSSR